jgi:PleD family two-component response regulator
MRPLRRLPFPRLTGCYLLPQGLKGFLIPQPDSLGAASPGASERAQLRRIYSAVTLRPIARFNVPGRDLPMTETILVVGSASADQQSVIWHLLKADYQVRYAASNSSAIRIISTETPSAVLLTQQPAKAQEICFLIRRVAPAIPVLVIGREDDATIKAKLFQADVDDYVLEPLDSAELVARIRSAVRRSKRDLKGL